MPYFVQTHDPSGRKSGSDGPYDDLTAAHEDAEVGAKQIVGDALRAGASLRAAADNRAFSIVDEAGNLVAVLSFWDLINAGPKSEDP